MINDENLTEHIVAVFSSHDAAAAAVEDLSLSGYKVSHFSVIGPDVEAALPKPSFVSRRELTLVWTLMGVASGLIAGLLLGFATSRVFGAGGTFLGGAFGAIVGACAGFLGSAAQGRDPKVGLAGAAPDSAHESIFMRLGEIGLPQEDAAEYEGVVSTGNYLVVVHGTLPEAQIAMDVFSRASASRVQFYHGAFQTPLGYR